ncbi:MAG TPA: hypothetical protein VN654_25055 [Vicinamibacterales bacterium]|nr:hypothetical protein [Vicinamibacterales bacterium]
MMHDIEASRLRASFLHRTPWKKWGPYLSERQWGTVREDYSANGDPWTYFPHDHARSRAYRWGEDGIAGISDDRQQLCFAIALWNGRDPILKERLFGLTNGEGNHGEDVKEYYYYLDSTPTHSYMKCLYKYPQCAFPYEDLVNTNRSRSRHDQEYELIDTGVFDEDKYFDVVVEYAKASPEDVLIRITATNRGPDAAPLDVLPTLWFRNTWRTWPYSPKPALREVWGGCRCIEALHGDLGERWLYVDGTAPVLFTDNETNNERLFGTPNATAHVKDAVNEFVVHGRTAAVNERGTGTKAAVRFHQIVGPHEKVEFRLRLSAASPETIGRPFMYFDDLLAARVAEADEFYASLTPMAADSDLARVVRQSMAGMLWNKQYYSFDLTRWLREHGADKRAATVSHVRDEAWGHMVNADILSVPDKWEYPWFAAWDLAFQAIALAGVDVDFAKAQLELMLRGMYMHPNGQLPASEWNFSDVHPPVHAWAIIFLHRTEQALRGRCDTAFLKRTFAKLLTNFTWWVNRNDPLGRNVFEGGCPGLDNVGVFDRSTPLPTGGYLEQADGAAWMSVFCQSMLEIAAEIAMADPAFEDMAVTFVDHFLSMAGSINRAGDAGMWDEEDGFYYDVLRFEGGASSRVKVRSIVGLLPLCATTIVEAAQRVRMPGLLAQVAERVRRQPDLLDHIHPTGEGHFGYRGRGILALVTRDRLRRILTRMLDESEFLSPFGIRTLSRVHLDHPYILAAGGTEHRVAYLPAESDTAMFGGNANWRGPIWMPMNALLIRALLQFYAYYGDGFTIECPTGSGVKMNLFEVAKEIAARLTRIFLKDDRGRRPVFGGAGKFQTDAHWRDHLLFYEYFHGDNGAGLGASHHTGWTGLVATLIQFFWTINARELLDGDAHEVHGRMHGRGHPRLDEELTA